MGDRARHPRKLNKRSILPPLGAANKQSRFLQTSHEPRRTAQPGRLLGRHRLSRIGLQVGEEVAELLVREGIQETLRA